MPFLLCRFPPWSGVGTRETPLFLGFSDDEGYIGQREDPGWPQEYRRPPGAPLVGAAPGGRLGTWWPPLDPVLRASIIFLENNLRRFLGHLEVLLFINSVSTFYR